MLQRRQTWAHAIWEALTENNDRFMTPEDTWDYIESNDLYQTSGQTPVNTVSERLGRMYNSWGADIIQRAGERGHTRYRINPTYKGLYPDIPIEMSSGSGWSDPVTDPDSSGLEYGEVDIDDEAGQDNGNNDWYSIKDIENDGCFLDEDILESMLHRLRTKQNIILQGPPGAGKTWLSKRLAYALIGRKDDDKVRQMQFHPNLSYEDFVRGWRPDGEGGLVLADGPFLKLCEGAGKDPDGKYVMVIEEINRGNPASIFGELLTLLESDKRSLSNALALAYPRDDDERFHIPPNVYVIGTMNLADRSLALVDFALRRRFAFFDLEPQLNDAWREWVHQESGIPDDFLADIAARIGALNAQIAEDRNLGKQFRIGHSHFTPPPDTPIDDPQQWFTEIVETEIAPLLREYWFDDPDRAEEESQKLLSGL